MISSIIFSFAALSLYVLCKEIKKLWRWSLYSGS